MAHRRQMHRAQPKHTTFFGRLVYSRCSGNDEEEGGGVKRLQSCNPPREEEQQTQEGKGVSTVTDNDESDNTSRRRPSHSRRWRLRRWQERVSRRKG